MFFVGKEKSSSLLQLGGADIYIFLFLSFFHFQLHACDDILLLIIKINCLCGLGGLFSSSGKKKKKKKKTSFSNLQNIL